MSNEELFELWLDSLDQEEYLVDYLRGMKDHFISFMCFGFKENLHDVKNYSISWTETDTINLKTEKS